MPLPGAVEPVDVVGADEVDAVDVVLCIPQSGRVGVDVMLEVASPLFLGQVFWGRRCSGSG